MLTPDGRRYLVAATRPVAKPFHLRWLLPKVLGENQARWAWTSRLAVVALAPLAWWYTGSPWMAACALLPGVMFNWWHPVLVDAPAMVCALLAACLWPDYPTAAIVVCVIGACIRETVPVWVAVYAWSAWPLVALVAVVLRWSQRAGDDPAGFGHQLAHPLRSAWQAHRNVWLDPYLMVLPWGALLLGVLAPSPQLAVALAAGYGQLVIATDSVRLYQWAWPVLALATVAAVPPVWLPLVAVFVAFNPTRGEGL